MNRPATEGVRRRLLAAIESVNAFQDRLVTRYFDRFSVAFAYWAFAAVFLYLGVQKVVPHRSTADVELATIGGLVGLPYIEFVTAVGVWQILIGVLFLLRRLRLCAWFFFSYQVFTFSTLVVLRRIVFQPPWLTVLGAEIPWALGSYSAFILKNLALAALFFVLASQELDTSDSSGRPPDEEGAAESWRLAPATLLAAVPATGFARASATRNRGEGAAASGHSTRLRDGVAAGRRYAGGVVDRVHAGQSYLVTNCFRPHGVAILYGAFAFVFFYFGFQKPAPVYSPVRTPLADFLPHFGIPLAAGMVFIGLYEMFLGLLFLFREIRVAFWFFYAHQAVTFLALFVVPFVAFQPPWLSVAGVEIPWALTGFGAFIVKNVVFVAAFTLLASIELGDLTTADAGEETG